MQKWQYKTIFRAWKLVGEKNEYVWTDAEGVIAHSSDSLEKTKLTLTRSGDMSMLKIVWERSSETITFVKSPM